MNLLLVRHGETAWNSEGRYQGQTDVPLSPEGERQILAAAHRMSGIPIARAVASPLSRARATAEAIIAGRGIELKTDARLVEIGHGAWEGQLARDAALADPELVAQYRTNPGPDTPAGPGGETFAQVQSRAWEALGEAAQGLAADATLLIVAHDGVNRALLCRVLGMPIQRVWRFRQAASTINALSGDTIDTLTVVRLNDAEHVAPLFSDVVHSAL